MFVISEEQIRERIGEIRSEIKYTEEKLAILRQMLELESRIEKDILAPKHIRPSKELVVRLADDVKLVELAIQSRSLDLAYLVNILETGKIPGFETIDAREKHYEA